MPTPAVMFRKAREALPMDLATRSVAPSMPLAAPLYLSESLNSVTRVSTTVAIRLTAQHERADAGNNPGFEVFEPKG